MRRLIRLCLLSSMLLVFTLPFLQAQPVTITQFRYVADEDREEFLHRETTYWSEIARAAIKEGKMVGWELWERVGGWNLSEGSNFIFVNQFSKVEDLNNLRAIWNPTKVFPKGRMANMETESMSTLNHQLIFQGNSYAGTGEEPNFIRVNYSKASDLSKYLELERTMWQPFIKKQIDEKNTSQVSWFSAVKIMPAGVDLPFNAVSVDGYKTMSEAVLPASSFKTEPTFPDMKAINEVHKKMRIQVYRKVKIVR